MLEISNPSHTVTIPVPIATKLLEVLKKIAIITIIPIASVKNFDYHGVHSTIYDICTIHP